MTQGQHSLLTELHFFVLLSGHIVMRVHEQAAGVHRDRLTEGELHFDQRLRHGVAVREHQALQRVDHEAHPEAADHRGTYSP